MNPIFFTIPIAPITKKNSQEIMWNRRTNKPFIGQSKQYLAYEEECLWRIPAEVKQHIKQRVNVKSVYYMPDNRKVDLNNLHSALHDILVKAGVLEDDNYKILATTDGSYVDVCKEYPRTEIEITEIL